MTWKHDDGGRAAAGFKGDAGDCTVRAIAIAEERPYREVYDEVNAWMRERFPILWKEGKSGSSRTGIPRLQIAQILAEHGWTWVPTMKVGQGTKVHLRADELPGGRIICSVSRHLVAVVDGVVRDTHDCTRGGTRAVYGYWTKAQKKARETAQEPEPTVAADARRYLRRAGGNREAAAEDARWTGKLMRSPEKRARWEGVAQMIERFEV